MMSAYAAVDLLLDGVAIAVAAVGGTYAIRTVLLLERNQEVLRVQRRIWLPILYAAGFLALDRVLHLSADLVPSVIPSDALDFIQVLLLIASLSLLSLGVYRYWKVQKEYDAEKFRDRAKETA
ncbi:MAG: hypothetical protein JRM76_07730 [Nitrososphaerota archaeon]|jgi:hypothetical protein|nr:hypothetical protein [Nitrososphaerota archaeon]MDG7034048.1 hypothetical protein [Nitrososphaerota archaeon]